MEMLSTPQLVARPPQMKTDRHTHTHTHTHTHAHTGDFGISDTLSFSDKNIKPGPLGLKWV